MFQYSFMGLVTMLFPFAMLNSTDFKVVKKDGPVVLYERWINHGREEVRELKAEFTVKSNPRNLISLLQNESLGVRWNTRASVYKVMTDNNGVHWANYIKYDMPFLMDDQDCYLLFSLNRVSDKLCRISFSSSQNSSFPPKADISRITGIKGEWLIEQKLNGLSKVTYIISSDRNRNIPRIVSDPIVRSNLINTMKNVIILLEQ